MTGVQDLPGAHIATAYIPGQAVLDTVDGWPVFVAPDDCTVTAIDWTPAAAVTGDDTDYSEIQMINKTGAGIGTTEVTDIKQYATGTDSVAYDSESLTLSATAANLNMAAGDVLAMVRTHGGNGLAQPDGLVRVTYKYR